LFSFSSSDPLAPLPLSPTQGGSRPSQIRKRGPSSPLIDNRHSRNTPQNPNQAAKRAILEARDLLVEAYTLTTSKVEQAKLLDLLEVFREYTENGKLQKASNIISSQIANLETTTRQIESKARALSKVPTPTQTQPIEPKRPTYATIATLGPKVASTTNTTTTAQEWTIVGSKKPTIGQKPKPRPKTSNRLILIQSTSSSNTTFSPLQLRNTFNKAFLDKGIKGPIVATISRSLGKNIVVTTTPGFSADFLLEKQAIWEHIVPFKQAQKDEPWHKVILHGIPTIDFNTPEGMSLVVDEIQTFNKGLKPIRTPY
jgi:hypothetical protein